MEELDTLPPQRRKLRGRTVDTEKHLKGCHVTRGRRHTCAGQQTKNSGGELKRGNFNVAQRNFFLSNRDAPLENGWPLKVVK